MGNSAVTGRSTAAATWFIAGAVVATTCWYWRTRPAIGYKHQTPTPPVDGSAGLRHVVMLRFRKGAPAGSVAKVEAGFAALAGEIDAVKSFEWGTNNSPQRFNEGFSHLYLVTFYDEKGRDEYLPHPKHKAFVDFLLGEGILDAVKVLDYNPQPVNSRRSVDPKIANILNLEIKPDRVDDFMKIAPIGARNTLAEDGCHRCDILRDLTAPNKFTIYEIYADNAAFEKHCATEHFKKWEEFKHSGALISCSSGGDHTGAWPPGGKLLFQS